jgi:hypothetical protein
VGFGRRGQSFHDIPPCAALFPIAEETGPNLLRHGVEWLRWLLLQEHGGGSLAVLGA